MIRRGAFKRPAAEAPLRIMAARRQPLRFIIIL